MPSSIDLTSDVLCLLLMKAHIFSNVETLDFCKKIKQELTWHNLGLIWVYVHITVPSFHLPFIILHTAFHCAVEYMGWHGGEVVSTVALQEKRSWFGPWVNQVCHLVWSLHVLPIILTNFITWDSPGMFFKYANVLLSNVEFWKSWMN